jgi:hypothetical protein
VTAVVKEGDKERKSVLKLAKRSGETSYGYLSSGDFIFSIPTETIAEMNPTLFSLKDKSLLSFNPDDVVGLDVTVGDKSYVFKKKRNTWKMTEPKREKIDTDSMDDLLGAIGDLSYSLVLADRKDALKEWGLDKPRITITLTGDKDKKIGTVTLGEEKKEGENAYLPVVSSSLESVYGIDATRVDAVTNDIDTMEGGK